MSIDTANQIINEQEDAIAELKHKVLEMEDARDIWLHRCMELVSALKRIECSGEPISQELARKAIDDYQGK